MSNNIDEIECEQYLRMDNIYDQIVGERAKQVLKWGRRSHPPLYKQDKEEWEDIASQMKHQCSLAARLGEIAWDDILYEEVAEAFEAYAKGDMQEYRKELVQVAAVVFAMLENLDKGSA